MNISVPYDFINFLVFEMLLKYEGRRDIKIKDLYSVYDILLDILKDKELNVTFIEDSSYNINDFILKYSEYFYIDGDSIYLDNEVEYNELLDILSSIKRDEDVHYLFSSTFTPFMHEKIFAFLKINSINDELKLYLNVEKQLEVLYKYANSNVRNTKLLNRLRALLIIRESLVSKISCDSSKAESYYYIADTFISENDFKYKKEPLDRDLWAKQFVYKKNEEESQYEYDSKVYSLNQYAIFGKDSLSTNKLFKTVENIDYEESDYTLDLDGDEIGEEYYEEDYLSEILSDNQNKFENARSFYIMYLYKIISYVKEHTMTKDLLDTYNRLMYAIDTPHLCLFKEDNLASYVINIEDKKLNLSEFKQQARFMAYEIFATNKDEYTLKKLLYISNYYDLTKDKAIEKIVNRHKKNKYYKEYSEIIFDEKENVRKLEK